MNNSTPFKYFTLVFLTLLSIHFSSINNCSAQNGFSFNRYSDINFNSILNDKEKDVIINLRSNKIIRYLKLTPIEREILSQIKELENEANSYYNDAELVAKEINEMKQTLLINNSNIPLERKIKRRENYELSLRFDAEELIEISNGLLYDIYINHFPTSVMQLAKEIYYQQYINNLNADANIVFKEAIYNQEKAYNISDDKQGLNYLIKANYQKREAIKKLEQAYALFYNVKSIIDEDKELQAMLNNSKDSEITVIEPLIVENNTDSSESINNNNTERPIYKIQIGAFTNPVNINKFHGLSNLTIDDKDQKEFKKFMVGQYYSYKAACEAKKIIIGTTEYKDAFIVSYKSEVRVAVTKEEISIENVALIKE